MPPPSHRARAFIAMAAGVLFALGTPPLNAIPLFFVGLGILAWTLEAPPGDASFTPKGAALYGWLFAVGANATFKRFIPDTITRFTPIPWALAIVMYAGYCAFESVRWALAGYIARRGAKLGMPLAVSLSAGAFAASFVPSIIPWDAASAISYWPVLEQMAELVGQRGVGALIVFIASLVALALRLSRSDRRRALSLATAAILLLGFQCLYGIVRMRAIDREERILPRVRVALLQPQIDAKERWIPGLEGAILDRLASLTKSAEARGVDLTVWSEAVYPYAIAHKSRQAPVGAAAPLQEGVHGPVLIGYLASSTRGRFNSAAIVTSNGALSEPQDKLRLVWFGETLPLVGSIEWFRATFFRSLGIVAGDDVVLQRVGDVRAAVFNCFEDILPSVGLEMGAEHPNLFINTTNDAWFEKSAQSEIHLRMAALRAVEHRRHLVRSVNAGVASWVDATGRVRARYDLPIASFLVAEPTLREGRTPYARVGDWPLVLVFTSFFVTAWHRTRSRRATKDERRL